MLKEYKNIIIFIAIVFLVICGTLFYFLEIKKIQEIPQPISLPENLKSLLLYQDIDQQTLSCLDKVLIEKDPKIGIYKFQSLQFYAEYFYLAHLQSVEKVKVDDCDFIKLNFVYEPKFFNTPFTLYIPEDMPSPGTSENTLPQEMTQYVNKRVEILMRYEIDNASSKPGFIKRILGWQLLVIYEN